MTTMTSADAGSGLRNRASELDSRYSEIGIPAVAAALRFQAGSRKPATAQPSPRGGDE